ncbi:MAG: hypothetical protein NUV69_01705 [Candidatus Curtissbacteria bacterium]|nr:hypothetical protein [Candidatus Curtissbacteria bacterium]
MGYQERIFDPALGIETKSVERIRRTGNLDVVVTQSRRGHVIVSYKPGRSASSFMLAYCISAIGDEAIEPSLEEFAPVVPINGPFVTLEASAIAAEENFHLMFPDIKIKKIRCFTSLRQGKPFATISPETN